MCSVLQSLRMRGPFAQLLVLAVALSTFITVAAGAPLPDSPEGAKTFRIGKRGEPIVLPVEIGEGRYPFLFDTGCSVTLFDNSIKPLLCGRVGPVRVDASDSENQFAPGTAFPATMGTIRLYAPNGERDIEAFVAPPMSLAGRALNGVRFVGCVDFEAFRRATGEVICGVIGMDAMKTMIVQIDFDGRELTILPSVPENAGEQFPLSFGELGLPSVRVEVGGRAPISKLFEIDTGYLGPGSGDLELQLFDSLLKTETLADLGHRKCKTIVRTSETRTARIAQLQLGLFRHSGLVVSDGLRNLLSLTYLSRYHVIFDFPHERMYLSQGKCFGDLDFGNLSGMDLVHIGGDVVVESIDANGAADKVGLLQGDVILEIGGVLARSLSTLELSRAFSASSDKTITIRRGGLKLRMKIELDEDAEAAKRDTSNNTPPSSG